jgi:hypothetical protein
VHGDLLPENALLTPGRTNPLLLLDWECYGLGDPAREAARLLHVAAPDDGGAAWLDRYLPPLLPVLPTLPERIAFYRRLLPFESLADMLTTLRTAPPRLDAAARDEAALLLALLHRAAAAALPAEGADAGLDAADVADYSLLLASE